MQNRRAVMRGIVTAVKLPSRRASIAASDIIRAAVILGQGTETPTSAPTSYRLIEATAEVDREVDKGVGNYTQNMVSAEVVGVVAQMMADEASQKEILLALGWASSGGAYNASLKRLRAVQAYIARRAGIISREVH